MTLASSATVNAKAFKSGSNPSAIASASFVKNSTGNTYYVAKTGSNSNSCTQAQNQSTPKLTVAAGLACLQGGDTLNIQAGTYNEGINNPQLLPISGSSWSSATTIQGYPVPASPNDITTTISGISTCTGDAGTAIRYFVFRGLRVAGGVSLSTCGNPGVIDHIMLDTVDVQGVANAYIVGWGADDSIMRNSKVHDNIQGTDASSNQYHCIYSTAHRTLIEHTEIYNCANYGIHQYSTSTAPSDNIYRYNWIHDSGNVSQTTRAILLCCAPGSNNQAYGNLLTHNTEGITCSTNDCLIYNNTIYDSYRQNAYPAVTISAGVTGARIKNNIINNSAVNTIGDLSGTSSNVISNNLLINPLFVNPGSGNFSLQSGSPAIDAGVILTEVASDIAGTPRPQGTGYDIGAFEYH